MHQFTRSFLGKMRTRYAVRKYSQEFTMRNQFDFGPKPSFKHWFPRHMGKGLIKMRRVLKNVDCIIEIHDARIPISGRNPGLQQALSSKPYLLLLNKIDLVQFTKQHVDAIFEFYREKNVENVIFTELLSAGQCHPSVHRIIPACVNLVQKSHRHDREGDMDINIMVVGIPNVGKSSLIKALRAGNLGRKGGPEVGRNPGHTRAVMNRVQVSSNPAVYLLDTPGIFEPHITDMHVGMKLALCNTVHDHVMGPSMVADYLLYTLNKHRDFTYTKYFNLPGPIDCSLTLLKHISNETNQFQTRAVQTGTGKVHVKIPDFDQAASVFLKAFREGKLGNFLLDDVLNFEFIHKFNEETEFYDDENET
nr:mitochondrial ribosome-associated GTPase 1 [Ciona intestinalis]|eukprot:XP_026694138.1 mitochondrial ribosome-associated GTPase 1 [Ciona intestinalis]